MLKVTLWSFWLLVALWSGSIGSAIYEWVLVLFVLTHAYKDADVNMFTSMNNRSMFQP